MVTAESDRPEPTPVRSEQRICFGLEWYDSEDDAVRQGAAWAPVRCRRRRRLPRRDAV
jgi:hypothetical protein